jgi:glycoprotein endo-alpha-1,2-mannosidase
MRFTILHRLLCVLCVASVFIPSVGPGYDDTRIRPWNGVNKRARNEGAYYREMWQAARNVEPEIVTLTSYNEWGEGTQLESAKPFTSEKGERLQDYGVGGPTFYMDLTRVMVEQFKGITRPAEETDTDEHEHAAQNEL